MEWFLCGLGCDVDAVFRSDKSDHEFDGGSVGSIAPRTPRSSIGDSSAIWKDCLDDTHFVLMILMT